MAKEYDVDGVDDDLGSDSRSLSSEADTSDTNSTTSDSGQAADATHSDPSTNVGAKEELPHRVRHDSPKDARQAKTFYLSTDDLGRIRELKTVAENEFDEKVHDLDVYVAAFRSDLSDEGFLEEMRNIGYGFFG